MYTLGAEEKTTLTMAYTPTMLVRGEVVSMQSMRVGIWLRTDSAPKYLHFLKPQIIMFGAGAPKSLSYPELLLPVSEMIGFHVVPPTDEPLDYDPNEQNRAMEPVSMLLGTFFIKSKIRIAGGTSASKAIDLSRATWMSTYDAEISNSALPQFNMIAPMMLINPMRAAFIL